MDPLELEALRLGATVLTGGVVALISSLLAFSYARRLQSEETKRQEAALKRALVSEISENLGRLRPAVPEGLGPGLVSPDAPALEGAWTQARILDLTQEQRDALGRAYGLVGSYNNALAMLNQRLLEVGGAIDQSVVLRVNSVNATADRAVKAFEAALRTLEPPAST